MVLATCQSASRHDSQHSSTLHRLHPMTDVVVMDVNVEWLDPDDCDEDLLSARGVLYGFFHPETKLALYIGKADRQNVRQRIGCRSKDGICDYLVEELGLSSVLLLVGVIHTPHRLTVELLEDIESLLIHTLKPVANIRSTRTRISRPGMIVECSGTWPAKRSSFVDA